MTGDALHSLPEPLVSSSTGTRRVFVLEASNLVQVDQNQKNCDYEMNTYSHLLLSRGTTLQVKEQP